MTPYPRRRIFTATALSTLMLLGSLPVASCSAPPPAPLTIAYSPFESTALLWIAHDQDFFSRNGLDVTLRKYDSGALSLDGVINGEADIALGATEYPLVNRAFKKAEISALAAIARSEYVYVVARKDRGISQPADLKGKRVGTTSGTIAQFFLGRFLELNGLKMQDITLVEVKTPPEWVDAVVNGDIDAVCTSQPYAGSAMAGLGAGAVSWSAQSHRPLYGLAIAANDWLSAHPALAVKFLKALKQAEQYALSRPADAKAVVQKALGLDPGYVDTVWRQNQFGLSLDESLVIAMEDEARWLIANKLTPAMSVPNLTSYIYTDALKAVNPGVVNIIS